MSSGNQKPQTLQQINLDLHVTDIFGSLFSPDLCVCVSPQAGSMCVGMQSSMVILSNASVSKL